MSPQDTNYIFAVKVVLVMKKKRLNSFAVT